MKYNLIFLQNACTIFENKHCPQEKIQKKIVYVILNRLSWLDVVIGWKYPYENLTNIKKHFHFQVRKWRRYDPPFRLVKVNWNWLNSLIFLIQKQFQSLWHILLKRYKTRARSMYLNMKRNKILQWYEIQTYFIKWKPVCGYTFRKMQSNQSMFVCRSWLTKRNGYFNTVKMSRWAWNQNTVSSMPNKIYFLKKLNVISMHLKWCALYQFYLLKYLVQFCTIICGHVYLTFVDTWEHPGHIYLQDYDWGLIL